MKPTKAQVTAQRESTLDDIAKWDSTVKEMVDAFFDNRVQDCELIISQHQTADPLLLCGAGLLSFFRYILSMEQEHADRALDCINACNSYTAQLIPSSGFGASLASLYKKSTPQDNCARPGEFRAKTIHAISEVLRTLSLVLQGSVPAYLKAGFAFKRGFEELAALVKDRKEREAVVSSESQVEPHGGLTGVDPNSYYNVDFGMGILHIIISILPDGTAALLNFFGMPGDRGAGVTMVRRCLDSNTVFAPFASAVLLAVHGVLPGDCAPLVEKCLPEAQKEAAAALLATRTQNSLMHLWLIGRIQRLGRDVAVSSRTLDECLERGGTEVLRKSMLQLRSFILFDQVMNTIILGDWCQGIKHLQSLAVDSRWSTLYYLYAQAAFCEMIAQDSSTTSVEVEKHLALASDLYWCCAHHSVTRLGGKAIAADKFISKRVEEILSVAGITHPNPSNKTSLVNSMTKLKEGTQLRNTVPLPAYEILLLFNLSHQVPTSLLDVILGRIDAACQLLGTNPPDELTQNLLAKAKIGDPRRDEPEKRRGADVLPQGFQCIFLLTLRTILALNSTRPADQRWGRTMLEPILGCPLYKDKGCSLSYAQRFLSYERVCSIYKEEGDTACVEAAAAHHKQFDGQQYYFRESVELRMHFLRYMIRSKKRVSSSGSS